MGYLRSGGREELPRLMLWFLGVLANLYPGTSAMVSNSWYEMFVYKNKKIFKLW